MTRSRVWLCCECGAGVLDTPANQHAFRRHFETTGHRQISEFDYAVRYGRLCRTCRSAQGRFAANEAENEYLCQTCWDLTWRLMEDVHRDTAKPDDFAGLGGSI